MEPEQHPGPTFRNPPSHLKRWLIIGGGIAAFLIIVVTAVLLSPKPSTNTSTVSGPFRMLSTNPKLTAVTVSTPFIKAKFSQPLDANVDVKSESGIIKSTQINGDELTINLILPLNAGTAYKLNINSVSSTSGAKLTNINLNFTAQPLTGPLPSDQNQALTDQQAQAKEQAPYSQSDLVFTGTDDVLNNGAPHASVQNMEQAFFNYAQSNHKKIYTIDLTNVTAAPRDPNSTSTGATQTFTVTLDNNYVYNGQVDYDLINYSARLHLYAPGTGAQVYDSGNVSNYTE